MARERVKLYLEVLKDARAPRFLTLTGPTVPYGQNLIEAIHRARRALRRLIHAKVFRMVRGGLYAFEITLTPDGFHLHLHVLVDATWIENREEKGLPLENTWRRCLIKEGEQIDDLKRVLVYVRPCIRKTLTKCLAYLVKGVIAKGVSPRDPSTSSVPTNGVKDLHHHLSPLDLPAPALRQLVSVLEGGIHLIEAIGAWRGFVGRFRQARRTQRQRPTCPRCKVEMKVDGTESWDSPYLAVTSDGRLVYRLPPDIETWRRAGYPEWQAKRRHGEGLSAMEISA